MFHFGIFQFAHFYPLSLENVLSLSSIHKTFTEGRGMRNRFSEATQRCRRLIFFFFNWNIVHLQCCIVKQCIYNPAWRRKWQPTPVFLPGKFLGWKSLVGYNPRGRKESGHDWATITYHNAALVSGVQQSDSIIHICVSIFFFFCRSFSIMGYCNMLNVVSFAIQ